MLQSLIPLLSTIGRSDSGARHSRHGRSRRRPQTYGEAGKIIWTAQSEPQANCYVYARKTFKLPSEPAEATLKITADSAYKLFVNGQYVGKGPVRSPHGIIYFDEHDITHNLTSGDNVIAVLAHHLGEDTFSHIHRAPGLLVKAEIEAGGETTTVMTDETWKVLPAADWTDSGARQSFRLGFQEVYDASKHPQGWNTVKFNARAWQAATVVAAPPGPWGDLSPREIPQLREERLLPKAVVGVYNSPDRPKTTPVSELPAVMSDAQLVQLRAGSAADTDKLLTPDGHALIKTPRGDRGVAIILDFGKEVFGNVEIGISGSGSGCIDLGYAELLEDGQVKPNKADTKYADRVLLHKDRLDWQSFEPRAFRYMQLEFRWCSRPVALDYVRVNQTTYPTDVTAAFECSDSLLNDIWKTSVYTTQLCMEDTYIDCPWRERAQWWADARIESRTAYYAFSDTALLAQGLRQIARSQRSDGAVAGMYPAGVEQMLPDFSLIWIFSLLDYYGFTDDVSLLRDLYPNMRRLLEWFAGCEGEFGLLSDVPGWVFIDWAEIDKNGQCTALNCLYYQGLRVASVIASVTGHSEDALAYSDRAEALRRSINKYFYSPRCGLYADGRCDGEIIEKYSRQTNIWAALFDVADHYQKRSICRMMLNGGLDGISTPYFASYLLEALYANDLHEEALDVMRDKWGGMLKAGATTFWEQFNTENSLCHGWAGCPARDLLAEVVGIKPVLGAPRFTVAPHSGGLRWAKGSIETATGAISVDWRALRSSFDMTVKVPEGQRVDVYAPCPAHDTRVTVNGKHWPSRFVSVGAGTHHIRATEVKPVKPGPVDSSLKPTEVPHVELLDEVSQRGRRLEPLRRRGRTDRRRSSRVEDEPQLSATEMLEAGIRAEPEPEEVETVDEVSTAETVEARDSASELSHRKPRRRGGRGRGRKRTTDGESQDAPPETEAVQAAEPVVEQQPEAAPAVDAADAAGEPAEVGAAAPTPEAEAKRKPRRRGGRGRGRKRPVDAVTSDSETGATPADTSTSDSDASSMPADTSGESSARVRPADEASTPQAIEPPAVRSEDSAQPVPDAAAGESGEKPKPRRRRPYSRRGGARRKKPAEGDAAAEQTTPQEDRGEGPGVEA